MEGEFCIWKGEISIFIACFEVCVNDYKQAGLSKATLEISFRISYESLVQSLKPKSKSE